MGITAIITVWALAPEVRRLIDWRMGFSSISLVSIVPLLALLVPLAALVYGGRIRRIDRHLLAIAWVWFGGFTSALVVAVVSGNEIAAAVYSYAEFCLPAAFGLWVASLDLELGTVFGIIARFFLALASLIAVYAMVQLAYPPAWDVAWMLHANIGSIGPPLPFLFRPFSTLNAPGPFADFLVSAILFNMPRFRQLTPAALFQVAICGAALVLTLVRSNWIALALGVACFLTLSPNRRANFASFGVVATSLLGITLALHSILGSNSLSGGSLGTRFLSLTQLESDKSYVERASYLGEPLIEAVRNPQGSGLGTLGMAAKLGAAATPKAFDNGYIARLTEMGWFGTVCYLLATFGALALVLGRRRDGPPGIVPAIAAVQFTLIALDVSSDHHSAFAGVVFWLSLALVRREPRV